jgi:hypothetical protein
MLAPTFALTVGSRSSSPANPVFGPARLLIERDMAIPADALRLHVRERAGISIEDEVTLAIGHDGDNETAFTGRVVRLRPGIHGVEILALGEMNALLNLRTSANFEDRTAGSIASELIQLAGLSVGIAVEGPVLPRFSIDERGSAFAHLKGLADRLGYELYSDRLGRIRFHALGHAAEAHIAPGGISGALPAAVGALAGRGGEGYEFGRHILGASATRQMSTWTRIIVGGESPMSGQGDTTAHWLTVNDADYRGLAGSGSRRTLVVDPAARYKDLADRFAAGRLAVAAREAWQIHLSVLGRGGIDLGDTVSASGVADAFVNGTGYVRAIRHRFDAGTGFVTDLRLSLAVES